MVGDGSYLMMNSEIATSVMLGLKLTIVRARQSRLWLHQPAADGDRRRELQQSAAATRGTRCCRRSTSPRTPPSLGAIAEKVAGIAELEAALDRARADDRTSVVVIDTDPLISTEAGGHWWDVAVPEVSIREEVRGARARYEAALEAQSLGD